MDYKRQLEFDKAYLQAAVAISKLSRAKKKQVGCIIVSPDTGIVAEGFNGTLPGMSNVCEVECLHNEDQVDKSGVIANCRGCNASWVPYEEPEPPTLTTVPEVIHAEINSILKAARSAKSTDGATLYSTLEPCFDCSKFIVASGIRRVVYAEPYRYQGKGLELLKRCGIQVQCVIP